MSDTGAGLNPPVISVPVRNLYKSIRFAGDPEQSSFLIGSDLFWPVQGRTRAVVVISQAAQRASRC